MNYSTPGVYTEEIPTLPPSVTGVSTGIPCFVGYTEKRPAAQAVDVVRITSMLEYTTHFGGEYSNVTHTVTLNATNDAVDSVATNFQVYLYASVQQYFQNGGGPCYIAAVGTYDDLTTLTGSDLKGKLIDGLNAVETVDEVTLLLTPDAMMRANGAPLLSTEHTPATPSQTTPTRDDALYGDVMAAAVAQCNDLQDRFCIFDVLRGDEDPDDGVINTDTNDWKDGFRDRVPASNYGASYYPWLKRSDVSTLRYSQITFTGGGPAVDPLMQAVIDAKADMDLVLSSLNTYNATAPTSASVADLRAVLNELISISNSQTNVNRFRDVFRFVFSIGTALQTLSSNTNLQGIVNGLKGDIKLKEAFVSLSAAVNQMQTDSIAGNIDNIDNGLNGTDWILIDANAGNYTQTNQIPDNYTPSVAATGNARRPIALNDLANGIMGDLNKIFSSYAAVCAAAEYNYGVAEAALFAGHPIYKALKTQLEEASRLTPAQGSVAGVYAATDRDRGVWKAPANVTINGVVGPAVQLSNEQQDGLNVDPDTGKSINALRIFSGRGTIVWGARTLLGNDNEWRYVSVRRFFIFAEESIRKASGAFVFEPNNANTWVRVKSMIINFLVNQWRAGALLGDKAEDAFFVKVGLGETMTQQDVLEGKMIVEVGLAAVRPAEFIVLKFTHNMPT